MTGKGNSYTARGNIFIGVSLKGTCKLFIDPMPSHRRYYLTIGGNYKCGISSGQYWNPIERGGGEVNKRKERERVAFSSLPIETKANSCLLHLSNFSITWHSFPPPVSHHFSSSRFRFLAPLTLPFAPSHCILRPGDVYRVEFNFPPGQPLRSAFGKIDFTEYRKFLCTGVTRRQSVIITVF